MTNMTPPLTPEMLEGIILKAQSVATSAHNGQFRRDGITAYITHPESVAAMVQPELKPIAWLHDVVEDTAITLDNLRDDFPYYVVEAVDLLTRRVMQSYEGYIDRLCTNPLAIRVKLADMAHNMSCQPSQSSITKIAKAQPILLDALLAHIESQARRVEEVERERDKASRQGEIYRQETHRWSKADKKSTKEIAELRSQLSLAHEAMRPFAEAFEKTRGHNEAKDDPGFQQFLDNNLVTPSGTCVGDFRKAFEALSGKEKSK